MTWQETVECQFTLLRKRVERLESLVRCLQAAGAGAGEASAVAREVGLDPDILVQPEKIVQRQLLGRELRRRGWSASRIARAMNCSERSVERWTSGCYPQGAKEEPEGLPGLGDE